MPYIPHPSERLLNHFHDSPWQGNDPMKAAFLFVGLHANFDADIDNQFPAIFDYLDDGLGWWRRERVHHPFRLPGYQGPGRRYHEKFAEIGFTPEQAEYVSFVELLNIPTIEANLVVADLCPDYLSKLNDIFNTGTARYIFLSPGVKDLMMQSGQFPWLQQNAVRMDGDLTLLREQNGQTIYQMYNFAVRFPQLIEILDRQIAQVREIARKFKPKAWQPINLAKKVFLFIVLYGCYQAVQAGDGYTEGKLVSSLFGSLKPGYAFLLELASDIAILGILPVLYYIIHSWKLSRDERRRQGLSLFMPKYVFIIYGGALFLLALPIILWSMGV
jgi:hypothetical protein